MKIIFLNVVNRVFFTILIVLSLQIFNTADATGRQYNQDKSKAYVYECAKNFMFIAKFDHDKVRLYLPRKSVTLPHVKSASGALYSDGGIILWNWGEQARLELGKTIYQDCLNNRDKTVWGVAEI